MKAIQFHKVGGKRFVMANVTGLVSTYLLMNGYIPDVIFRDLIIATVATYISANTFQLYSENRDKYNKLEKKDESEDGNA